MQCRRHNHQNNIYIYIHTCQLAAVGAETYAARKSCVCSRMYARHPQQQLVCACVHDRSSHTFNNHCHRSLSVAGRQAGWGRRAQSTDARTHTRDGRTGRGGVTACSMQVQRTFLCILRARVASCCKAAALACSAASSSLVPSPKGRLRSSCTPHAPGLVAVDQALVLTDVLRLHCCLLATVWR